jgi:hypothetical protein
MLLVYAPISLAAIPAAFLRVDASPSQMFVLSTSVTVLAIYLLAALVLLRRLFGQHFKRWVTFLAISVLAIGAVRGYFFVTLANSMGINDPVSDAVRILNSTLNTGFWVLTIVGLTALVQESIHRYESHFVDKALEASIGAEQPQQEIIEQIDSIPQLRLLKANLQQLLRDVNRQDVDSDTLLISALKIRDSVENSVRPLSHKIWFSEKLIRPRIRGRGLLADLFKTPKFAPIGSGLVMGLWLGIGSISAIPLWAAALGGAIVGINVAFTAYCLKWLIGTRELPIAAGMTIFSLAGWVIANLTDLTLQLSPVDGFFARNLGSTSLLSISVFLVLVTSSFFLQIKANFAFIEDLLDSVSNLGSGTMRSEFAGYLHNSLQAQLTSIATQLEKAAKSGGGLDPDLASYLTEVSRRSIGEDFANRSLAPIDRLGRVVRAWSGIIDVRIDSAKLEQENDDVVTVFTELVEESISNAVRHASADWISFDLQREGSGLRVEIRSPSLGDRPGSQSLGTSWLASKSKSFEVSDEADGTRLTKVLI